ncbi:MAG: zinc-ribbon domain-containing protein [Ruminococcus sp.]|nr:zinc-ribbon domain-containing protein [Ruminococcus sp.]
MFCPSCGNSIKDNSLFCSVCGANIVAAPQPAPQPSPQQQEYGLPAGIMRNEKGELIWEGECRASKYKAIYTVSRWVVGIITFLALIIMVIVYSEDGIEALIKPVLIVLGAGLIAYLISAGLVTLLRDGRLRASFALREDGIAMREIKQMPESGGAIFASFIVGFFSLIGNLFLLFSDNNYHGTYSTEPYDKSLYRTARYKKIKEVTPSADRTSIRVKRSLSSLILLVTPEQCDYLISEIEYRIRQTK